MDPVPACSYSSFMFGVVAVWTRYKMQTFWMCPIFTALLGTSVLYHSRRTELDRHPIQWMDRILAHGVIAINTVYMMTHADTYATFVHAVYWGTLAYGFFYYYVANVYMPWLVTQSNWYMWHVTMHIMASVSCILIAI